MGTYIPLLPPQNFVPTKTVVTAAWLNLVDGIVQGNVPATGPYGASIVSGQVQVTGPNGFLTSYGDLTFALQGPNPSGIPAPTLYLGGAGKLNACLTTDAQTPGLAGIRLIVASGESDDPTQPSGDLLLIGGGGADKVGQVTLQGCTSLAGPFGGTTAIWGGNATVGQAGNLYLGGGQVGPIGGGSVHLIMTDTAGGNNVGSIVFRVNSTVLWTITSSGAIFFGSTGAGLPGYVLFSNGPNALPNWAALPNGLVPFPLTALEVANGAQVLHYNYLPGNVFRYYTDAQIAQTQAFTSTPTLDCSAAINMAVLCSTGDVVFPTGVHYINAPIYVPQTSQPNIRFVGESRTNTKIEPMANSIADLLAINAMVINQATNKKLSFYRIRLTTGDNPALTAWSGFSIHADQLRSYNPATNYVAGALVSSGGLSYVCIVANAGKIPASNPAFWTLSGTNAAGYSAANSDYIFSGSIEDCWFDAGGVQPAFVGGLNNYLVQGNTFEFQKGCFSVTGGTADAYFKANSLSNCYDYFIQDTMSPAANIITIEGLHVYTHNRGLLFLFINAWAIRIKNVFLQAAVPNLGGVGIGSFVVCRQLELENLSTLTNATLGTGATGTQLTFQACSAEVSDCNFDGVDLGVVVTGGGTNQITFNHVDIVNTNLASFAVQTTTGTPAGFVDCTDCNWSDGQNNVLVFTNQADFDMTLKSCRFMNAGLGANPAARNLSFATTGLVRLTDCQIGQNNAAAAAQYYIDCAGPSNGQVVLVDPVFFGTAPLSVQNPAASQQASIGRQVVPFAGGFPTFSAAISDKFEISCSGNVTVGAPTGAMDGKEISVIIKNTTSGAIAVGWAGIFKVPGGLTTPAGGSSRAYQFYFDGTNWRFQYQSSADVPN